MSRSSMTSHVQNAHHISINDYKKANYPDIEVETNWFQCRLCPTRTKFVKDCVAPHLKMSHNLEIEQYEKDFMQPEDWPTTAVAKQPKETAARLQNQLGAKGKPRSSREMAVLATKEDKWNKCKFQCAICEWVCVDSRQMRSHIAAQHSTAYDKYVQQYGSSEVVSKKFRCELCNSVFKHCRQNIYAHMKVCTLSIGLSQLSFIELVCFHCNIFVSVGRPQDQPAGVRGTRRNARRGSSGGRGRGGDNAR